MICEAETGFHHVPYGHLTPPKPSKQMRLYFVLALLVPCVGFAQQPTAPAPARSTLSLGEALDLARRNNPAHLSAINNRRTADAAVRAAQGQLLPSADASFNAQRQQGGRQIFGGTSLGASSDVNQSSYQIGIGYRLNRATFLTPRLQRASRDAVEADIAGSAELLRADVTQQYLSVLRHRRLPTFRTPCSSRPGVRLSSRRRGLSSVLERRLTYPARRWRWVSSRYRC